MINDFSGDMFREFANEDLSKDKDKYLEFSEIARQLNSGEIDIEGDKFFIDCIHQPYRKRKEYNHIDAYFINLFYDDYYKGNIIFAILKTEDKAYPDSNKDANNSSLNSASPIHGDFETYNVEFLGGAGYCDGHLEFQGDVIFMRKNYNKKHSLIKVPRFDGLLEVGYCDIATIYAHLFVNCGQLARFPYNHNMIGLFIKTDFKESVDRIISSFNMDFPNNDN